ncbi:hypothetical protein RvY_00773-3 [Ramazzottius varieornatus]|uniref:Uncharacterized protein n=1 Tax=Ramazzottius varieornatus TaxID=947166 RepID=A0A1D1UHL7_RAMVA|nr:hypothetical protein RvY_00773-3 [Ramazzottius varieornatus]
MEQRFNVTMPVLFGKKIMPGQLMLSCMNDQSLFVTLGLGSQFNITQIRDQLYSFNISGQLNSLDANLNDVVIYSSATDTQFQKILTGLSFDFNPFYAQLDVNGNPLPYVQLGWFRGNISAARATAPTPPTPVDYFDNVLAKIDAVEAQMHVVDAGRTFVSANISVLATSMVSLKLVAISTQNMAINGQTRISSGGMGAIVKQAATLFAARTFSIVDQFLDYFEGSVMTQAGKCRPAYDAVQGIASLFCDGFIKPLNGFWFALGLALAVFLFVLCCNCSLARYYKRAKVSDTRETRRSTFTERRLQLMNMNNPIRRARKVGDVRPTSVESASMVEEEG